MATTLSDWLIGELRRRGLSMREGARQASVDQSVIRRAIQEGTRPHEPSLRKIASWAGVTFDYLYNLTYSQPRAARWPVPATAIAIEQICSKQNVDIPERIDEARARIPAPILQRLDRLARDRGADDEGRLTIYEAAIEALGLGRGQEDGDDSTDTNDTWTGTNPYSRELGDLPPR